MFDDVTALSAEGSSLATEYHPDAGASMGAGMGAAMLATDGDPDAGGDAAFPGSDAGGASAPSDPTTADLPRTQPLSGHALRAELMTIRELLKA